MGVVADAVVVGSILHSAWAVARAIGRAGDALVAAPWPRRGVVVERPRLRIVRPVYDWQKDGAA